MQAPSENLTKSQLAALEYITAIAKTRKSEARAAIAHICRMSNISLAMLGEAVDAIKTHAKVALHFHPDWPDARDKTVAESLLESGVYESRFETMPPPGNLSALPGGECDQWEGRIFGGAYHFDDSASRHRPKYGALNLMLRPDGPSPQFGPCYFILRSSVSPRCTFTYRNSHQVPKRKGSYAEFDDIVAALLSEAFSRESALGESGMTPQKLLSHLVGSLQRPFFDPQGREPARNLNHYIEAQVHGDVSLLNDVEILVADPAFKALGVGRTLGKICEKFAIELYWHSGFALAIEDVPDDFRGPAMPSLAKRIATKAHVDVGMIGPAAFDLKRHPESWSDRGSYQEVLQELSFFWHVLVRYGRSLRHFEP